MKVKDLVVTEIMLTFAYRNQKTYYYNKQLKQKKSMELTKKFIETIFDKYNKEYWGGNLRKPKFEITRTKSTLGQFNRIKWLIRVSNRYDRSETDYINTILHEMIHLYIRQNNIIDTNRHHGREFFKEADRLNQYGWHIARTDSVLGIGLTERGTESYCVLITHNAKGKYFRMCINPKYIKYYKDILTKHREYYKEWFMFWSNDDKIYAAYPKCRESMRGWFISKEEYENCKAQAKTKKEYKSVI